MRRIMDFLRPSPVCARRLGLNAQTNAAAVRAKAGYMPGELSLPEHVLGQRVQDDSAALRGGIDLEWRRFLVHKLGAQREPQIRTLSKVNNQKIALLDALQQRAPREILDEPTDGLDPLLCHRIHDILRNHARDGSTVFLSSHVVPEIQPTCGGVSIILDDRLRKQDKVLEMLACEPTRIRGHLPDPGARTAIAAVPGTSLITRRRDEIQFQLPGQILPAMQALIRLKAHNVVVKQHDLEETFLELYGVSK
jgi:ABC-2 type transport system ATP-binding protein